MKQKELLPLMQNEQQRRESEQVRKRIVEEEAKQFQAYVSKASQEMEVVQRETRTILAESAQKMTETQAQIAQATSEAIKAIAQFGMAQQHQPAKQEEKQEGGASGSKESVPATVSAAIKAAMKHVSSRIAYEQMKIFTFDSSVVKTALRL
jgi:uncharacterized protein YaaW (UPF0174 family)